MFRVGNIREMLWDIRMGKDLFFTRFKSRKQKQTQTNEIHETKKLYPDN
jgi:hypothetical protein